MWTTDLSQLPCPVSDKFATWLAKPLRLARAMRTVGSKVSVRLLRQGLVTSMLDDEVDTGDQVWCREVLLCGDSEPWCFARIVVPMPTYTHFHDAFNDLGEALLGDAFLYQQSEVERSPFEFSAFESTDVHLVGMPASTKDSQSIFFARRSQFMLHQQYPLTVMEVFLDAIPVLQEIPA